jgi:RimJ/RimL family protein N-acetyltransferase
MYLPLSQGKTWPFENEFETLERYKGYFLSHAAFVVRSLHDKIILGCFYVKPNFPGRCSHICNGGFITAPEHQNKGVATLMGRVFLQVAKDLQYKSAYFNLVFKSNTVSVRLWEKLGFQRVAVLEKAARLEGLPIGVLDTAYGYRFDLETLDDYYLWKSTA